MGRRSEKPPAGILRAERIASLPRGGTDQPGRAAWASFPDQILFGTDRAASEGPCGLRIYEAWFHALTGNIGDERDFDTCTGLVRATGMQLGTPHVDGCRPDVPEDVLDRFLRENLLRLYE